MDKGEISLNEATGVFYDAINSNIVFRVVVGYDVGHPNVTVRMGGYKVVFFIDAGVLDYTEFIKSPDGRSSTFNNFCNQHPKGRIGCPLDELTDEEYGTLEQMVLK